MSDGRWYVVQVHPRRESFTRMRIEDLGCEVFLPLVRERRKGQRRAALLPLFPGYLFIRMDEERGDLARVRWCHGVRRVLGDGPRPRPIANEVVEMIRERADGVGCVRLGSRLKRGEPVRITDGPLAGLYGILERPATSATQRVCVLLDVFHRWTRVELSAEAVCGALTA